MEMLMRLLHGSLIVTRLKINWVTVWLFGMYRKTSLHIPFLCLPANGLLQILNWLSVFLKSLAKAEDCIVANPDESKAFIQQKLNYDNAYMASVWPNYTFSLNLGQPLVIALEDQSRWIISKNLTEGKQTPNFLNYIYFDGLNQAKPEAVSIIR